MKNIGFIFFGIGIAADLFLGNIIGQSALIGLSLLFLFKFFQWRIGV